MIRDDFLQFFSAKEIFRLSLVSKEAHKTIDPNYYLMLKNRSCKNAKAFEQFNENI